jgi:hypothetical protein
MLDNERINEEEAMSDALMTIGNTASDPSTFVRFGVFENLPAFLCTSVE